MDQDVRHTGYVGRAAEETQRLLRELLVENERLQSLSRLLERDNVRLQEQLDSVAVELERSRREHESLRQQLSDIEVQSRSYAEQYTDIEQRNLNLANLYVASYQLHGTLDRQSVLDSIREIVVNLIGSEEMAVFELSEDERELELATSFGIDESEWHRLALDTPIGRQAMRGETLTGGDAGARPITACVPLKLDGRVTGVIVLFSLLPHKPELQELDHELFDLLATHAATALYCTRLRIKLDAGAAA
jgi:hypothetical protein